MYRFSRPRPRYPQKRNPARLLFLIALPCLLVIFLVGVPLLFDDDPQKNTMSNPGAASAQTPRPFTELTDAEAYPRGPLSRNLLFDKLRLEKSKRRLSAYAKGTVVRVYLVALGQNPVGPKEFQGDMRTPEGEYVIHDKNPNSAYHKNLGVSYPNDADRAHAAAANKDPGGDIKIHGLPPQDAAVGPFHRVTDWTHGCIAVTNDEIEELFVHTQIGVLIEIVP